ncbi:MAG: PAS domain-containing protein, partial [Cellvibrionaceae bacterium]|nr:PAS domain-containing protein [Cellvibrionaceae bacterium]
MRKNLPVQDVEVGLEESCNILSITDELGKIQYVNDDFVKVSGFDRNELIGEDHNIVRHPDMPAAAFADLWAAIKGERSWKGVVKNRCKDGSYYWVDAYIIPIRSDGEIRYQSVRQKPKPDVVQRAKQIYLKLNRGQGLPRSISIRQKMFALVLLKALLLAAYMFAFVGLPPLLAAATGGFFGFLLGAALWGLWRPWAKVLSQSRQVSSDPLARYIYTGRQDEAAEVEFALQSLRSEAAGLIGRIEANAKDFHTNSGEIRASSNRA